MIPEKAARSDRSLTRRTETALTEIRRLKHLSIGVLQDVHHLLCNQPHTPAIVFFDAFTQGPSQADSELTKPKSLAARPPTRSQVQLHWLLSNGPNFKSVTCILPHVKCQCHACFLLQELLSCVKTARPRARVFHLSSFAKPYGRGICKPVGRRLLTQSHGKRETHSSHVRASRGKTHQTRPLSHNGEYLETEAMSLF